MASPKIALKLAMSFARFLDKNLHLNIGEGICTFPCQKSAPLSTLLIVASVALETSSLQASAYSSAGRTGQRGAGSVALDGRNVPRSKCSRSDRCCARPRTNGTCSDGGVAGGRVCRGGARFLRGQKGVRLPHPSPPRGDGLPGSGQGRLIRIIVKARLLPAGLK